MTVPVPSRGRSRGRVVEALVAARAIHPCYLLTRQYRLNNVHVFAGGNGGADD
jgi:hypothetical protein